MKTTYISCTSPNCKRTFRNQSSFDNHMKESHSDSENQSLIGYRCKKCKRVLGTKQSLKEHFYTHTGQKPYKCNEFGCTKTFRQSSQLSYHKRIHREVKKYFDGVDQQQEFQPLVECISDQASTMEEIENIEKFHILPKICGPQIGVILPNIFN